MKYNKCLIIVIMISMMFCLGCSNSKTLEKNTEKKTTWRITKETLEYDGSIQDTYYEYDENGNLYVKKTEGCDTFYVYKNGKEQYHYEVDTYEEGQGFIYPTWSINVYHDENENDRDKKIDEIEIKVGDGIYPYLIEVHYFDKHNRIIKDEWIGGEEIRSYEYKEFNKYGDYTKTIYSSKEYEDEKLITSNENENIVEYEYENGKKIKITKSEIDKNGIKNTVLVEKNTYNADGKIIEREIRVELFKNEGSITYYDYDEHGNIIQEKCIVTSDDVQTINTKKYEYEKVNIN